VSRPHRTAAGRTFAAAVAVLAMIALVACGDSSTDDAGDELSDFRARAASAASGSWSAVYALEQTKDGAPTEAADVAVAHRPDALRLDITTPQTTTTLITTSTGTVTCQATGRAAPTCLQAAGPGQTPPPALDPGLREVLDEGLQKLGEGFGTVEALPVQDGVNPDALCARVTGEDVPAGVYCLLPDGVPATITFPSGSITLTSQGEAPADPTFQPPASPAPL
jgi:hypothetical protein